MGGAYETRSNGTIRKYYGFAGMSIAMRAHDPGTQAWTLSYLLTDHLGSMVGTADVSGTLTSEQRYLPFGEVREDVGTIAQTDFGYTGQRDQGMGLMDYKARFYILMALMALATNFSLISPHHTFDRA